MTRRQRNLLFKGVCLPLLFLVHTANARQTAPPDPFALSFEELLDVEVVTSSRRLQALSQAPGVLSVVSREQIKAYGATSLVEALELAPGVLGTGTYMFPVNSLSIRGDQPGQYNTHVLILLDGQPVRETQNGGADLAILRAMPLGGIKQLEIIRGPGSVQYGTNAFSGVVNIVTDPGVGSQGITAALGSGGRQMLSLSQGIERQSAWATVNLRFFNDRHNPYRAQDETNQGFVRDFDQQNLGMRLAGGWGDWQFSYLYTDSHSGHGGTLPIASLFTEQASIEATRQWLSLSTQQNLWQGQLSMALTYNAMHNHYTNPGPQPSYMDAHDWQWDVRWQRDLSADTTLTLGIELQRNKGDSAGDHAQSGHIQIIPAYQDNQQRAFSEIAHQFNQRLSLVAGLQLNKAEHGDSHLSSRVSANYQWQNGWLAKIQYAEAYRAPSMLEQGIALPGVVLGNRALQPETTDTWDAQLAYNSASFYSAVSLFYSHNQDLIIRRAQPGQTASYFNFGEQRIKGLEWESRWQPADSNMRLELSWTYQQNQAPGVNTDNASSMPRHLLKLGWIQTLGHNLQLGVHMQHVRGWQNPPGTLPYNPLTNPQTGVNAHLNYHVNACLSLWLDVDNVFDQSRWQPEVTRRVVNTWPYLEQQRQLTAGIDWRF